MNNQNKKDNFIKQAGILAMAGIIVRIIGILYRSPITSIIGDQGNGYYNTAYNIYAIILLISSYSIPSAISKVIASRLAFNEYKNAQRLFYGAMIYVSIVGLLGALFAFFGAPFLVESQSVRVLQVLAPTIFLSGILGVLRGYFQAHKTMLQTSVSQIIEQILNAIVSILAAYLLTSIAVKTAGSSLLQVDVALLSDGDLETKKAIYGAVGSAMGTGAGVIIGLLFMILVYGINKKGIARRIKRDKNPNVISYEEVFKIVFSIVTPFILSTFIYNFSTSLNQTIYMKTYMYIKGFTQELATTNYGIFSGKSVVIANIPIAIASSISAATIPTISESFARNDKKTARAKVHQSIQTTMLIAIPAAVGLFCLAKPVTQLLFPQKVSLNQAAFFLQCLSITIVFYSLSTVTNGVLQAIGKVNKPVINASLALVIQTGILAILLFTTELNQVALVIAMIVYSLLMCVLNGISVATYLRYKQEWKKTFILPGISSLCMGAIGFILYFLLHKLFTLPALVVLILQTTEMTGKYEYFANVLALLPSITVAAVCYFVILIKIKGFNEQELLEMPKGALLVKFAKKFNLL